MMTLRKKAVFLRNKKLFCSPIFSELPLKVKSALKSTWTLLKEVVSLS